MSCVITQTRDYKKLTKRFNSQLSLFFSNAFKTVCLKNLTVFLKASATCFKTNIRLCLLSERISENLVCKNIVHTLELNLVNSFNLFLAGIFVPFLLVKGRQNYPLTWILIKNRYRIERLHRAPSIQSFANKEMVCALK